MRERLLAKAKEKAPTVPITVFGEDLFVRRMSARERDAYESSMVQLHGKKRTLTLTNLRARLAVLCLVDADGNRVLTDSDADQFGEGDCTELDRVYDVARKHNVLDDDAMNEVEKK